MCIPWQKEWISSHSGTLKDKNGITIKYEMDKILHNAWYNPKDSIIN